MTGTTVGLEIYLKTVFLAAPFSVQTYRCANEVSEMVIMILTDIMLIIMVIVIKPRDYSSIMTGKHIRSLTNSNMQSLKKYKNIKF